MFSKHACMFSMSIWEFQRLETGDESVNFCRSRSRITVGGRHQHVEMVAGDEQAVVVVENIQTDHISMTLYDFRLPS